MDIFKVEELKERVDYDSELIKVMLIHFLNKYALIDETLKNMYELGIESENLKVIHDLKGVTTNLSMKVLNKRVKNLEKCIKKKDINEIRKELYMFKIDLGITAKEVRVVLDNL